MCGKKSRNGKQDNGQSPGPVISHEDKGLHVPQVWREGRIYGDSAQVTRKPAQSAKNPAIKMKKGCLIESFETSLFFFYRHKEGGILLSWSLEFK
ncbi:hypothetical protein BTO30_01485 [Domibacillus antri]|uniref:Uncharacterized protein n=1 Tax=Domibacillus antri TaxID=1714264 RepID=A0A1Q8Q9T8_9BACI|nr:hypothetical protein BTO30_01485 [Domibacillus antri]